MIVIGDFIHARGQVRIDIPVAAANVVTGSQDAVWNGGLSGPDQIPILVKSHEAAGVHCHRKVLPFVQLKHAAGGDFRPSRRVVVDGE